MLEKTIQSKIVAFLKQKHYIVRKLDSSSSVGWPDLIAIAPSGRVYFFEVKTATGKLSKLQTRTLDQLKRNKANAYVVRSTEEVGAIITA
tara:strand:+ start:100 stop:369 length:270 start_codon:yes stop_codon:yes gene_type:complete